MPLPNGLAAQVLFASDRTCCVCRHPAKSVQLHHIDGNNSHHVFENLAVLCLECHAATLVQGGFHRRLDADQIRLYREDWLQRVSKAREAFRGAPPRDLQADFDLELVTSIVDRLQENGEYELLARLYHSIGNRDLRDKYIAQALKTGKVSEKERVCLSALKGESAELTPAEVRRAVEALLESSDYVSVARLMVNMGCFAQALRAYCQGILEKLEARQYFNAAYLIKEARQHDFAMRIFEAELEQGRQNGELWRQVLCLQEMERSEEMRQLLISNRREIESGEDPLLRIELYRALGDAPRFRALAREAYGRPTQVGYQISRLGMA